MKIHNVVFTGERAGDGSAVIRRDGLKVESWPANVAKLWGMKGIEWGCYGVGAQALATYLLGEALPAVRLPTLMVEAFARSEISRFPRRRWLTSVLDIQVWLSTYLVMACPINTDGILRKLLEYVTACGVFTE